MEARALVAWLEGDEGLDLELWRHRLVVGRRPAVPFGRRAELVDQLEMLAEGFVGECALLWLHAGLNVALRRGLQPERNARRFLALWQEHADLLLEQLDTRWLISACDSFADGHPEPEQAALAASASFLVNTVKLYETERQGPPGAPSPPPFPAAVSFRELFDGLTTFLPERGDMVANLVARLEAATARALRRPGPTFPVVPALLRELVTRLLGHDTVLARARPLARFPWPVALAPLPPPVFIAAAGTAAPPATPPPPVEPGTSRLRLPRASGPRDVPMALAVSLSRHFAVPLNRDGLRDFIDGILQKQPRFNLVNAGQLIDHLGLRVVLSRIPRDRLARVPVPAVLLQHGQLVLLDGVDGDGQVRLLEPELGPLRLPAQELQGCPEAPELIELLLVQRHPASKEIAFSWSWFLPYVRPHTRGLVEVLAASVIVNTLALVTPLGMQVLIDQVARFQNMGALISISALLLLASVVVAVVRTLRTIVFAQITNRIDQDSKATILDHLVRLPQDYFDSRPVGHVMYYFNVLDRLREFLVGQSLTTVVDFLFSFLYIFVLLLINPLLTLVTLSTLPLLLVVGLISNPIFEHQVQRTMSKAVVTSSYLNESITGIQTIKSQNAELKTRWEFLNRYAAYIGEDFKLKLTSETTANIAGFVTELNSLLVIGFGIWLVMQNQLTLGGFIAFRIIAGYITRPLMQVVVTWQQFRMSTRQMELVADIVDRPTEQSDEEASNIPMPPIDGHVRFDNVGFRFAEDGPMVLQGIQLDIPTGSFVGMVGGSGSGKSTLLKLLPRFYRALEGKVLIDGLDVSKVELYSLRRQVGVVPQDSLLFDGTIRENLLLVKPDATVEELIRATRIACAHEFIMEMPQGYNSSVGERGAGLSGGQRQRLALARAVLQNPRMLILDEATSALDARTERQVCINLFEAFRGRTVFFITHRLSTVRPADMIVLMDKGAVMEVGSHDQLMEKRGWYYALFRSQLQEGLS